MPNIASIVKNARNLMRQDRGVTPMRVSEIVRGQRGITADTALRLSRYFNSRPAWWLDLQNHYDLELAADEMVTKIARIKPCAPRR